jgi:hypothetical protein
VAETFTEGSGMGLLARLFTVGAVTALSASALVVAPATADTSPVPAPSATTPASSTPETRKKAKKTGLQIKIQGVSAGARASVKVTGPKQRTKGKRYSTVIHRSKTLKVRPGKYKIKARTVTATGGTDVPTKATKKVRVRKNKIRTVKVLYTFVATPAPTPAPTPVPPATCAEGGTCVVGDTGRGGGKVFYVAASAQSWGTYLEAAPADVTAPATQLRWAPNAGTCYNTDITAAQPIGIGAGETNTAAIVGNVNCDTAGKAPAAWAAHDYTNNGFTDWFLPSQDELNQMCRYAWTGTTNPGDTGACDTLSPAPSGTPPPGNGGFTDSAYWSSSQRGQSAIGAWVRVFTSGIQNAYSKNNAVRVRPIRAF